MIYFIFTYFLYQGGKNMKQKTYEMLLGIQTIFMKYEYELFDIELQKKIYDDVHFLLSVMYGDKIFTIIDILINPVEECDECRFENLFINKKTGKIISDINKLEDLIYGNIKQKLYIDYDKYIN